MGRGRERLQVVLDADCGAAEADGAVRRGEGLVQVELAHVEAGVARPHDAQQRVAVRLVVGAKPARLVHDIDEFADTRVVLPGILGIGQHQAGGTLGDRGLERIDLGEAHFARHQRDHLEARDRRRRRIGGVGEGGGDDLVALAAIAARFVIGADQAGIGVDALRAARRLEGERVHARDGAHHAVEAVEDLQRPLQRLRVLQRMNVGEARQARDILVHLGAVFHGAGAHHVGGHVEAHAHLRESEEVPEHPVLGQRRQRRRRGASHAVGQRTGNIADGIGDLLVHLWRQQAASAAADLVDERLVPARGVEAGSCPVGHRIASPRAETSLSISAAPWSSVTQ